MNYLKKYAQDGNDSIPTNPPGTNPRKKNKSTLTSPAAPQAPGKLQSKAPAKAPVKDSPDKQQVKNMQDSILRVKEALESLELGNPNDVGGYDRGQKFETSFGHGEEYEMYMGDTSGQVNRSPDSFKRNQFQNEKTQNESLDGTNPLGTFLLKNYINTALSSQFTDLDVVQPERMQEGAGAMKPTNFKGLVDTVGHIGTPKPERQKTKQEELLQSQLKAIENRYKNNPKIEKAFEQMNEELDKQIMLESKSPTYDGSQAKEKIFEKYRQTIPEYNQYKQTRKKLNDLSSKLDSEYNKDNKLGEESKDGIWSVRTNNALKSIYAILSGLVNFANDMNIKLATYNQSAFSKYKQSIPSNPENLKSEDKQKLAQFISGILTYFSTKLIPEIKGVVLESKETKAFANQSKSFFNFSKRKDQAGLQQSDKESLEKAREFLRENTPQKQTQYGQQISSGEDYFQRFMNQYNPQKHVGIEFNFKNKRIPISFSSLSTPSKLSDLYQQYLGHRPTVSELKTFLKQIKIQLTQNKYYNEYKKRINMEMGQSSQ